MLGKAQTLETLRQQVAALEAQPPLKDFEPGARPQGLLAVPPGVLHEVFADGLADAGSALGFALAQARSLLQPARPGLLILQLKADAQEQGLPYGLGLSSFGLDSQAIVETQAATLALAARLSDEAGASPPLVNLGGGFGIPYFAGDMPVDVERIGTALRGALAPRPPALADSRFALELGRWLVGEAGVYLTRIVDRKESQGETFLVVDGGLHHQLAASGNFGTVVRRNYPAAIATRFAVEPVEEANVVGCLCTPLDRLADQALLPRAEPGDLVAVFCAGAYGASASPSAFLGQGPAREMLV